MKKIIKSIVVLAMCASMIMPSISLAQTADYATLNITTKDANGSLLANVSVNIYEQGTDYYGKPYLGDKIVSGSTNASGFVSLKFINGVPDKKIAIEYYKTNKTFEKYDAYNFTVNGPETKAIVLTMSSARVIMKDQYGQLDKDYPFDIYSATTDYYGNKTAGQIVFSGQTTGADGTAVYLLTPNNYILRVKYSGLAASNVVDQSFTVYPNAQTDVIYALSAVKVSVRDSNGVIKTNANFKLSTWQNNALVYLGQFSTGSTGYKIVNLPVGSYRLEYQPNSSSTQAYDFNLGWGLEKELIVYLGIVKVQVYNPDNQGLPNMRVYIYKYDNGVKGSQVYSATTDGNGLVATNLSAGNYIAEIDGYNGLKYSTNQFYVDNSGFGYSAINISQARIFLQYTNNQVLYKKAFNLYKYATDANGNVIAGAQIGSFNTGDLGYTQLNLPTGNYVVKPSGLTKVFPFYVQPSILNYVNLFIQDAPGTSTSAPAPAPAPALTPLVCGTAPAFYASWHFNDLNFLDTDADGLSNFQEYFMYNTNPFVGDSDNDGYLDSTEVSFGYNPNGSGRYQYIEFRYNKPRLTDICLERNLASYLNVQLKKKFGKRGIPVSATNWSRVVNAYIYGGYSIDEIYNVLKYGAGVSQFEL